MSPLSLIVADYRYQVHFSTPRFAGVSKTTRHGEYGKQRWKIAMHRWFQCAFIRNTVVNGAQHRYLHQSQIGNAFGFKHRIEWAQHWILRCSAPFPTVLGIVPDGAHFSSTVGNGAEVFPCSARWVRTFSVRHHIAHSGVFRADSALFWWILVLRTFAVILRTKRGLVPVGCWSTLLAKCVGVLNKT